MRCRPRILTSCIPLVSVAPPDDKKVDASYHWLVWSISGHWATLAARFTWCI